MKNSQFLSLLILVSAGAVNATPLNNPHVSQIGGSPQTVEEIYSLRSEIESIAISLDNFSQNTLDQLSIELNPGSSVHVFSQGEKEAFFRLASYSQGNFGRFELSLNNQEPYDSADCDQVKHGLEGSVENGRYVYCVHPEGSLALTTQSYIDEFLEYDEVVSQTYPVRPKASFTEVISFEENDPSLSSPEYIVKSNTHFYFVDIAERRHELVCQKEEWMLDEPDSVLIENYLFPKDPTFCETINEGHGEFLAAERRLTERLGAGAITPVWNNISNARRVEKRNYTDIYARVTTKDEDRYNVSIQNNKWTRREEKREYDYIDRWVPISSGGITFFINVLGKNYLEDWTLVNSEDTQSYFEDKVKVGSWGTVYCDDNPALTGRIEFLKSGSKETYGLVNIDYFSQGDITANCSDNSVVRLQTKDLRLDQGSSVFLLSGQNVQNVDGLIQAYVSSLTASMSSSLIKMNGYRLEWDKYRNNEIDDVSERTSIWQMELFEYIDDWHEIRSGGESALVSGSAFNQVEFRDGLEVIVFTPAINHSEVMPGGEFYSDWSDFVSYMEGRFSYDEDVDQIHPNTYLRLINGWYNYGYHGIDRFSYECEYVDAWKEFTDDLVLAENFLNLGFSQSYNNQITQFLNTDFYNGYWSGSNQSAVVPNPDLGLRFCQ